MNAPAAPASWLRSRLSAIRDIFYAMADAGLDDPIPTTIERRLAALEQRFDQLQGTPTPPPSGIGPDSKSVP